MKLGRSSEVESISDPTELDRLLRLTPELIWDVTEMKRMGQDLDAIIWHLYHNGVTKAGVASALRRSGLFRYAERKTVLHQHPAYVSLREADEHFQDDAIQAMQSQELREKHAA